MPQNPIIISSKAATNDPIILNNLILDFYYESKIFLKKGVFNDLANKEIELSNKYKKDPSNNENSFNFYKFKIENFIVKDTPENAKNKKFLESIGIEIGITPENDFFSRLLTLKRQKNLFWKVMFQMKLKENFLI